MRLHYLLYACVSALFALAACDSDDPRREPEPKVDPPVIVEEEKPYTPYQVDMTGFNIHDYLPSALGILGEHRLGYIGLSHKQGDYMVSADKFGARILNLEKLLKHRDEERFKVRVDEGASTNMSQVPIKPDESDPYTHSLYSIFTDVLRENRPISFLNLRQSVGHGRAVFFWSFPEDIQDMLEPAFIEDYYTLPAMSFVKKYYAKVIKDYTYGFHHERYTAYVFPAHLKNPPSYEEFRQISSLPEERRAYIEKHIKTYYVAAMNGGLDYAPVLEPAVWDATAKAKSPEGKTVQDDKIDIIKCQFPEDTYRLIYEDNIANRLRAAYEGKPVTDIRQEPYIELARYEVVEKGEITMEGKTIEGPAYALVPILHTRDGSRVALANSHKHLSREEVEAVLGNRTSEGLAKSVEALQKELSKHWSITVKANPNKIFTPRDEGLYELGWSPFDAGTKLTKHWDAYSQRLVICQEGKPYSGVLVLYKPDSGLSKSYGMEQWIHQLPTREIKKLRSIALAIGL